MSAPALVNKNGFCNFRPTISHGPLYAKDYDSDGSLWLPAVGGSMTFMTGTWTPTRAAAGDYYQAVNATAQTSHIVIDLSVIFDKIGTDPIWASIYGSFPSGTTFTSPTPSTVVADTAAASGVGPIKVFDDFEAHIIRGVMLTAIDVVYNIGTANLTTHTLGTYETTYNVSAAAGTVVTEQAATALGIVTSADITIGTVPMTTPYVIGGNASVLDTTEIADYAEIVVVNPGTSVYHLYGVRLYFDYCLN